MNDAVQFQRRWRLYQLLSKLPEGETLAELADRFQVSSKTIQRDIATLRAVGLEVVEIAEKFGLKRWRVQPDTTRVPNFLWDEAVAIYLGRKFLEPLAGTIFWEASQRAFAKLKATFKPEALSIIESLGPLIHQTSIGSSDYSTRAAVIDGLMTAIEDHKVTTIEYQSLKADAPRPVAVQPLGMVYHEGSLFLVAIAEEHGQIRHYKVDRLSSVDISSRSFMPPEGFDLKQHLSGTLGVYGVDPDQPLRTVRIRFAAAAARYIQEHEWHKSQTLEPQADGTVVCTLQLASLVEVQSWILSFGPRAEALEPPELREAVKADLERLREVYR
jgi:predicted DNA-binding transcriptional regulator YafY